MKLYGGEHSLDCQKHFLETICYINLTQSSLSGSDSVLRSCRPTREDKSSGRVNGGGLWPIRKYGLDIKTSVYHRHLGVNASVGLGD